MTQTQFRTPHPLSSQPERPRAGRRRRWLAALTVGALTAAMWVPMAAPAQAQAAPSVVSWDGNTEATSESINLGQHSASVDPGYAVLNIEVSPPLAQRSHVIVEFVPGSSSATPDDFLWPSSGANLVALPAGTSSVPLRFYGTSDRKTEGSETAVLRLVKVPGGHYTVPSGNDALMQVRISDTSTPVPASADARRGVVLGADASGEGLVRRLAVQAGSSVAYTVSLASAPGDTVSIVPFQRTERSSDISFSPRILTFTPSNWFSAQTVTVSAPSAAESLSYIVVHVAYSSDGDYDSGAHFRGPSVDSLKHLRVEVAASS